MFPAGKIRLAIQLKELRGTALESRGMVGAAKAVCCMYSLDYDDEIWITVLGLILL